MKFAVALISLISFTCTQGIAAPFVPPPAHVEAPSTIQKGKRFYDGSVDGLGDMLEDMKKDDQKTYDALLPDYKSLKTRRIVAIAATAGSLVGGLALIGLGAMTGISSPVTPAVGTGLILAAVPLYWILYPGRSDIMKFINKHNDLSPSQPLDFSFGYDPATKMYVAGLNLTF